MRRCKVIGTIGPSSSDPETLEQLVIHGLDIARLNFSHGEHSVHKKNIATLRMLSKKHNKPVAILQDLQGPKIRTGNFEAGFIQIQARETYRLFFGKEPNGKNTIPIDYEHVCKDVANGNRILMDDGTLPFVVEKVGGDFIEAKALVSGKLKNRKGVNFPDSALSLPALTEKDKKDLVFGIESGVDLVALSFVQRAEDIQEVQEIQKEHQSQIPIIAKIEKPQAVENIRTILHEADGIMIARGDLGVEVSPNKVPAFQRIIEKESAMQGKPFIIATQMLESMIENPEPTIAEISDVANGVLEAADCLMLSGEVAAGQYPVQSLKKMVSIIEQVETWNDEESIQYRKKWVPIPADGEWEYPECIAKTAVEISHAMDATWIVCLTLSGKIAHKLSKWRPKAKIVAVTPRQEVALALKTVWGVHPIHNKTFFETEEALQELPLLLKENFDAKAGELAVFTAGVPLHAMCATNMIKVNKI
jgi:pyruvate kinase